VIAHSGTFREEALAAEIAWLRAKTPYELWGDAPWWLASLVMVAAAFVRRPPRGGKALKQGAAPAPADEAKADADAPDEGRKPQ
jgi:hypothetical protein